MYPAGFSLFVQFGESVSPGANDFCWSLWVFRKLCPVITILTLNSFSFRIAQSALFRIICFCDWLDTFRACSYYYILFLFIFIQHRGTHRRIPFTSRILFYFEFFWFSLDSAQFEIPLTNRSGQQWMFDWGAIYQFPVYGCAFTSTAPRPLRERQRERESELRERLWGGAKKNVI